MGKLKSRSKKGPKKTKTRYNKCVQNKMKKIMKEFESGSLKSRGGYKVTNSKQAIAIGLSKARKVCSKKIDKTTLKLYTKEQLVRKFRGLVTKSMTKDQMLKVIKSST